MNDRIRIARDLALQRLGELQSPDGSWFLPIEINAAASAIFIIMLRTTGLIEKEGQFSLEVKLLGSMP